MWNYAMERSFPCHNPLKPRCQNVLANEDQKQAMLSQKDCVSPVLCCQSCKTDAVCCGTRLSLMNFSKIFQIPCKKHKSFTPIQVKPFVIK